MAEELFDVLDEAGARTGAVKARAAVHRDGDFHRAAHVWVLDPAGRTLLARRSASKDSYPGAWDMAADGHVGAGEASLVAAAREVRARVTRGMWRARARGRVRDVGPGCGLRVRADV